MKKNNLIKPIALFTVGLTIALASCKRDGCTDPVAQNYEKRANQDDGTCTYGPGGPDDPGNPVSFVLDYDIDVPTVLPKGTYSVTQTVDVNAALTLTPGSVFIFEATFGLSVKSGGSVSAVGTAVEPIVFKGKIDNSPGYWAGIDIGSNNPNNHLEYVTVQDAGSYWGWENAGIYVGDAARLTLKNSSVNRSKENGLFVESDATLSNFTNNSFANNLFAGVNVSGRLVGSLDAASNYNVSNGEEFVQARGGTISVSQTWQNLGTPILLSASMDVDGALTLNPGIVILLAADKGIDVTESGSLTAVGTAALPITIQGQFASPGYAAGVDINSNNPLNKFVYVNMAHLGSYWYWDYAGIHIDGGRLEIDNCSISNSNSWAVYAETSSTVISNGSTQTDAAGTLVTNTMTGNGAGPDADCVGGGCTIYFN